MESSDDSFIWTDASSNSEMALDVKTESESDSHGREELLQDNMNKKKTKKRKFGDDFEDSFNGEKKCNKIKAESGSDIDVQKKKKKRQNESSISKETGEIDDYLNIRVKQEQESFAESSKKVSKKKKKHKKDNDLLSNDLEEQHSLYENETEDYGNSKVVNNDNTTDDHIDDYLSFRVKQEQASFVEPLEKKSKKKRKSKKSLDTSDNYDLHLSESVMEKNDCELNFEKSANDQEVITKEEKDQFEQKKKKSKKKQDNHNVSNTDDNIQNSDQEMSQNNFKSREHNTSGIIQNTHSDDNNDMAVDEDTNKKSKTKNKTIKKRESKSSQSSDIDKEENKQNKSMSERLRFEDEDTADYTLDQSTLCDNWPKQIRNFVKLRKNITHVPLDGQEDHFVSEEDDIWIIKCPHEFDVKDYVNVNLTLDSKCKLKLNGQNFVGTLDDSIQRVPIVTTDHTKGKLIVKNVPVMGLTKFRKRIPKAHIPDQGMLPSYQNSFIPLPETKCRHPLFGADYKKAIKIPSGVAERLHRNNVAIQDALIDSCKPKKKKHKKEKFKIENDSSTEIKMLTEETQITSSKKKRKRKYSDEVDGSGGSQHKSKRVKQELDSTDVWESEQAIENSLFGFE